MARHGRSSAHWLFTRSLPVGLGLLVLPLAVPMAGAQLGAVADPFAPPGAFRGAAALEERAADLSRIAARNSMTRDELVELLQEDDSVWIDASGRVIYVDPWFVDGDSGESTVAEGTIPLSQAFQLHSRPGADHVIYLDFDGHHSVNNSWGHDIQFPPFNTSGSASSFSDSELQTIINQWRYVAEDFAPFEVDVTTEEPSLDALTNSGGGDSTWGVRCVMTQATDGFGNGIGGVAFLNSFNDSIDNPVFAFNKGDNNGSMTASHEVGHAFGLRHDGLNSSTYHPGTGSGTMSWGPIMGAPFGKNLVQWSNGDYAGATSSQDDVEIITSSSNGVTFKQDDHGDTFFDATPLVFECPDPAVGQRTGLIHDRNDVDVFRLVCAGGPLSATVAPTVERPNLDLSLELYDASGVLMDSSNPAGNVTANLSTNVSAGTYYLSVEGVGNPGVNSDYGSLGEYDLMADLPLTDDFADLGSALVGTNGFPMLQGSGFACSGNGMSLQLTGAVGNAPAALAVGLGTLSVPFKGGTFVPDVNNGNIIVTTTSAAGAVSASGPWLGGIASGLTVVFQYWIQDAGGPEGFAASNAVELVVP